MTTNPKKISVEDCQGDLCCVSLTRDAPVEKKEPQRQHHLYYHHHHHLGWDAIGINLLCPAHSQSMVFF